MAKIERRLFLQGLSAATAGTLRRTTVAATQLTACLDINHPFGTILRLRGDWTNLRFQTHRIAHPCGLGQGISGR